MEKTNTSSKKILQWIYKLRSVFLSVPVAIAALVLALYNTIKLPNFVTFSTAALNDIGNLAFQNITVSKFLAAWAPFGITMVCLVMVFLSRKVTYPWLISLFSLCIPILLLLVNTFP